MGFVDFDAVGVGVGFAVFVGDGLVVGLGLEVVFLVDVVGVGLGLGDVLDDVPPVAVLVEALGDGEALAELLGDVDVLADAPLPAGTVRSVSAAMTAEFLGTDEQTVLTIGCVAEFVARASPDMLAVKKANPVRAPITTGFASCALTREPHFSASSGQNVFRPHIMHCQPEGN